MGVPDHFRFSGNFRLFVAKDESMFGESLGARVAIKVATARLAAVRATEDDLTAIKAAIGYLSDVGA